MKKKTRKKTQINVLHVVTYMSRENSFGGPVGVAQDLASGITDFGFGLSTILSVAPREDADQLNYDSPQNNMVFRARTLSKRIGFSGYFSLGLLGWILRHAREFDVVHVHLARDLVTSPVALLLAALRVPYVIQTHGMVEPDSRFVSKVYDLVITRRIIKASSRIFYLTESERSSLETQFPGSTNKLFLLENAVSKPSIDMDLTSKMRDTSSVVFAARLQERKRPSDFVLLASQLAECHYTFSIIGPDEGLRTSLEQQISKLELMNIRLLGAQTRESVRESLAVSGLLVLPSINEPFPITILEALSVGTPVIVTSSCGFAERISLTGAGLVVSDGDIDAMVAATRAILENFEVYSNRALLAHKTVFSFEKVISQLVKFYGELI